MTAAHRRREPSPGLFRLVLPLPWPGLDRVNAYLLADEDGATLVDCGIWDPGEDDGGWSRLGAALEATGHQVADVRTLVITHTHIDHYGMAARLVETTGCELWMHEAGPSEVRTYAEPDQTAAEVRTLLVE
ncbi:MAG: MBL fold metallo-hydrolase, partial [Actinomycetota bacterium]